MRALLSLGTLTAALVFPPGAQAAGNAERGAQLFRECAACHSTRPGEHMTGPSLAHVVGKRAASVPGFARYSQALEASNIVWNETMLDRWLANPAKLVPGTAMGFPGIADPGARQDLIAFLEAIDRGNAPARENGAGPKPDLKKAPPEGRVRSITYCGDTYTVETADGRKEKVWEYNLRFKTDSSARGPKPGQPVAIGAGMQGDRASIVFASPEEISRAIRKSCP